MTDRKLTDQPTLCMISASVSSRSLPWGMGFAWGKLNRDLVQSLNLPTPRRAAENLSTSAGHRGKPPYLCRGQTSLTPRRAPNNEMSLEVTQRKYVDDNGHRAPGRANTCHF